MKTPAELAEDVLNLVSDADRAGEELFCTKYDDRMVWELVRITPRPGRDGFRHVLEIATKEYPFVLIALNNPSFDKQPDPKKTGPMIANLARLTLAYRRNRAENRRVEACGDW